MRYIIILALLAVAAGCDTGPTVIDGHYYTATRGEYIHQDTCPNPIHTPAQGTYGIDWKEHVLSAAPAGTRLTGSVFFEQDTMNRLGRLVYYACYKGTLTGGDPAYFRLEMDEDQYGILLPSKILHIHTCATQADTCRLLFDERGYYAGCNCGGNESIIGLP